MANNNGTVASGVILPNRVKKVRLKPANIDYSMSVNNNIVFEHKFHKHR